MAFSGDGKYKNSVNYVKGMKALQDSNYAEAMKYLNKEIAKNPDNGYAYYGLGMAYEATGNPSEALDNFNIAIKNIPSDDNYSIALAYSLKARVLRRLGDSDGAMENFNKAVETCPESADFYVMRGMEFRDHGKGLPGGRFFGQKECGCLCRSGRNCLHSAKVCGSHQVVQLRKQACARLFLCVYVACQSLYVAEQIS